MPTLHKSTHTLREPFYLNRAIQHGLTKEEFGEALAHIAFYAGWGHAVQAAISTKELFQQ